jgi:drug/metabolite transporter (DMT)-like permease
VGLGLLSIAVHIAWYASLPRTSVATNAVIWNTDTLTTPLIGAMVKLQWPSKHVLLAGILGFVGTLISVDSNREGNTVFGCFLCFTASTAYAVNSVLVEKLQSDERESISVLHLLSLEGLVAAVLIAGFAGGSACLSAGMFADWIAQFPPLPWFLFYVACCICLNVGWLWCTELAGASWTAMAACLSIPLSMILDLTFLGLGLDARSLLGATLILLALVTLSCQCSGDESCPQRSRECLRRFHKPLLAAAEARDTEHTNTDALAPLGSRTLAGNESIA